MPTNHNYDNRVKNPIYHVVWGVRFFFSGIRELTRQPALLGLSLIPILLTFVLLLGLALGGAWIAGRIVADVFGHDLRLFVEALTFALALVIGYFLYLPVARVLLAPFAEALSRKTHAINAGNAIRQSDLGSARAMWEGLKLVMFQSVIALLALALGLIFPPVGAPVGVIVAIFLCGLDFFDIPLSTRGLRLRRKLSVIWRNKSLAIGFGAAAYLMLLIPVINLFSLPVGVIGATLLADALERGEEF
ncbi:MAG: Sulfate transporter CysZ [Acidobacteria bacterium]|nr:Sulfate transporter CysZ [Acidobacteriota bacterium]